MKKARNLSLLVVVSVLAVVAVLYTQSLPEQPASFGQGALFPGLAGGLEKVTRVQFERGDETAQLSLEGGGWLLESRLGYPADRETVRRILFGVAHLAKLEAKTRNPEHYGRLGLDEASAPARLMLLDGSGTPLLELLAARRVRPSGGELEQFYVRTADDPQVWLVEGRMPLPEQASDWLADELVAIDTQRIRTVEVRHPDGAVVRVNRDEPSQTDFALSDLKPSETVSSVYALNGMASVFADLRLKDVRTAKGVDWSPTDGVVVEMTTFDGLRLRMHSSRDDEALLAAFSAEYDPSLRDDVGASSGLESPESVQGEVANLAARFEGWLYELPEWRLDSLSRRREDLVEITSAGEQPQ